MRAALRWDGPECPSRSSGLAPRGAVRPARWLSALPMLACFAALAACARNPVTHKNELSLVSESQEIEMGKQSAAQVAQTVGLYPDSATQAYVSRLGLQIAAKTERPNLPWQYRVVDDPAVNAFALPGGFVFVTRGLLTHMTNEAELASVLGHESGHVAAKHSVQQMSQQEVAQIGLGIGMVLSPQIAKYGQLASAGLGLLFLKFSRDDETQADDLGFRYALNDGYDVRQMIPLFQMLDQETKLAGGTQLPEWQETHPDPGNRIAATQQRITNVKVNYDSKQIGRDRYLAAVDGMVFGDNPRQGYFQGSRFLHPDLKFQLEFPPNWKTQNSTDAVVAASPAQDAMIQLQPAQGGAAKAAQQFFAQQGLQSGNVSQGSIHGLPAVTGEFSAQTSDQTPVHGRATFIDYGGTTYQLVSYTTPDKFSSYDPLFQRAVSSFDRLTDPALLDVQPMRIKLERASRSMTLQEFNTQYPSSVPLAQLAVINGVSTTAQIPAGQLVKRVIGNAPAARSASAAPQ